MGSSKKHKVVGDGKKCVIAGTVVRAPLKLIPTKPSADYADDNEDNRSITPTAKEARISQRLHCPPAPKKRLPTASCHFNGNKEFFTPPDLESVFIRLVEKEN